MSNKPKTSLRTNQEGIVAVIVAVILMLILSLIVLAVSQNATREQRQALDRQLSEQAFYNAESGINDAANYLYAHRNDAAVPALKPDCTPLPGVNANIDGTNGINKYTCIQYNRIPKSIIYDELSTSTPKVARINGVDPVNGTATNIANLTISWDDAADRDASLGSCDFPNNSAPALPQSCPYGGVKAELVTPHGTRDQIRTFTSSYYLLPSTTGSGAISLAGLFYPETQGILKAANCNNAAPARRCSQTISGLNGNGYFLALKSLYQATNVTITATGPAGQELGFKDAQIMIDATGRSGDILRRVQVRLPAGGQYTVPGAALQTKDSICKLMRIDRADNGVGSASSDAACPIN